MKRKEAASHQGRDKEVVRKKIREEKRNLKRKLERIDELIREWRQDDTDLMCKIG